MKKIIGILLIVFSLNLLASDKYKLSVYVNEFNAKVDIVGYSEEYYDEISLPAKAYTIKVSQKEFKTFTKEINLNKNLKLKVDLVETNSPESSTMVVLESNEGNEDNKNMGEKEIQENADEIKEDGSSEKKIRRGMRNIQF